MSRSGLQKVLLSLLAICVAPGVLSAIGVRVYDPMLAVTFVAGLAFLIVMGLLVPAVTAGRNLLPFHWRLALDWSVGLSFASLTYANMAGHGKDILIGPLHVNLRLSLATFMIAIVLIQALIGWLKPGALIHKEG